MIYRYKKLFISLIFIVLSNLAGLAQENTAEYNKTIEMADSYFTKGDYINAKASYQIAVRLAPEEQYPKDRLQQSLDMIKVQMYQNSLYTQKIQVADEMFQKNDMAAALQYYQEAISILPGDVYASGKIQEINRDRNDIELLEENYQKCIINGDLLLKGLKLENALAEYRKASDLKPSEKYPKEQAVQIEKLIADGKVKTSDYENFLQEADLAISRNKYDEAINALQSAINLLPDEPLPKQKLAEAQNLKAAWDSYSTILSAADELYISKDFQKAKDKYLQAQSIKPADEYPKSMLEKIDIALMDLSQANRSSYEFTIELADKLFNQQEYEQAMIEYKNALRFRPDEEYAKQRISDINNALSLRKTQEDAYTQSVLKADNLYKEERFEEARDEYNQATVIKPLEQYPKVKVDEINTILSDLASKKGTYNNLIKGADRLFFSDEYVEAREQYREANYLFPKEKYPLDQITMINEILGLRDKYVKAVTRADQLLQNKDYEGAMLEFRNASGFNPDEAYPKEKIREIESLMAKNEKRQKDLEDQRRKELADEEIAMTEKEYQEALAAYQKEKIFEIKADSAELAAETAMENQYLDAISSADIALGAKEYQKALADFQAAKKLKPGEVYAEKKITEINIILGDLAVKEALDKQYSDAISVADNALAAKEYQKALSAYQSALSLKPGEAYAQGKITETNTVLGDLAAKEALDKQYSDAISGADKALAAKDYQKALSAYQSALSLKPGEAYAQGKITEINTVLGDLAAKEALNKQYSDAISGADNALAAKDYQKALAGFQSARNIKPDEQYVKTKILEIETHMTAQAKQLELDNQYIKVLAVADEYYKNKQLEEARSAYQEAQVIKPAEDFPGKQIILINQALETEASELNLAYNTAVSKADIYFEQKDYDMAKLQYNRALELKPNEQFVLDKLALVNEQMLKNKQLIQAEYDKLIVEADKSYASKTYDDAISSYRAAALLNPDEEYPKEMAGRILKLLTERSIVQLNKEPILITNNTQHKFDFTPVAIKDRKSNYIFFRARNVSTSDYKLIISFGKDQIKNGGVVIKVPAGEELYEYVVRISSQYKWFSDDNNWISFYPEGGDFEVNLMQISYSD